jgi:hypothetical protein
VNLPWLFLSVLCTGFWLGFLLHTSSGSELVLGKYSQLYTLFLIALTALYCWLLWLAWQRQGSLARTLHDIVVLAGITVILMLFILPPAYIFLHNRSLDKDLLAPLNPQAHAFLQFAVAPDIPLGLDNGTIRILALGGSTTYGSQLERDETYPAVLEQILQQNFPDTPIKILNAGVPWYSSMYSLLCYISHYADWKPHVIIVMHAFNDIFQTSEGKLTSGKFRTDYGHFFGALGKRVNPRDHFREKFDHILNNNWLARTWYSDLHDFPVDTGKEGVNLLRALPSFHHNMTALVYRAFQDNAQVVIANQPFLYRENMPAEEQDKLFYDFYYNDYALTPDIDEQMEAMQAFNETSRELAKENGTWFVDLESNLIKSTEFMYDDVHYSAAGAHRVANIFLEQLPWNVIIANADNETIDTLPPEDLN